ncbi:NAD-dependent epimerase/dehydratase family protein [Erwinia billingiae]|uniref:NAD-dependent epimerase/dehydratase family protein n=1 Tax=Erwinia billingiae TaxID=182337 RepID=UPI001243B14B|nr:NAD-dependent epimerase/dehydratase family protein [Erwinia billingiae]QEW31532.1 NAD-dependent epimerase/dehydratase family protein [Erwinia billingiae]
MQSNDIYIVGWKGFIGTQFLAYLFEKKFTGNIFLYQRDGRSSEIPMLNSNVHGIFYDEMVNHLLRSPKATVLYLANSYSPGESLKYAKESVTENILPFITLLESIKDNASNIKFIFSSSGGSIYGDTHGEYCKEVHNLSPKSIYAANKLAQEYYLDVYLKNYGLDYQVLRIANPYGPGQQLKGGQGLIPAVMNSVVNNTALTIYGDGTSQRDYLYIDDLADAIIASMNYTGSERIFNIGSGRPYSILDIIECFNTVHSQSVEYVHVNANASEVNSIVLDISRAKKAYKWSPKVSLEDGIAKYIKWYDLQS